MKTLKLTLIIGTMLTAAAACNQSDNTISGIYVMSFKNEYSIATDTLVIEAYNLTAGTYKVERRDGYHRIRQGKILAKEFRQEKWMATFDKNKSILQEGTMGRQIFIKGDRRTVDYNGIYSKIK